MKEIVYPSHDGINTIHAYIWKPEGEIKGVVQIIHGMVEHATRYARFAEFLCEQGFAVCAEDHLGHGLSVKSKEDLGYFNKQRSTRIVLDDIHALQLAMQKQVEGKPYFIMGHSMGSFFCRKYITLFGNEVDGAIVMGTGFMGAGLLNFALAVVRLNALFCGWRHRSKFIKSIAFGSYNKKFKADNSANAWLSVNKENVKNYEADELCGYPFTNNGYSILFGIIKDACSHKTIESVPKKLPVYFVSGGDDPVGGYGKGVKKAYTKFVHAYVEDVSITLYEGARHEILNDFCSEKVYADILEFLNSHIGAENG